MDVRSATGAQTDSSPVYISISLPACLHATAAVVVAAVVVLAYFAASASTRTDTHECNALSTLCICSF